VEKWQIVDDSVKQNLARMASTAAWGLGLWASSVYHHLSHTLLFVLYYCMHVLQQCAIYIYRLFTYLLLLCRVSATPGKSWNFFVKFQVLEVLQNDFGPGKSWKFKLNVLESAGLCWDTDVVMQMRMQTHKYSCPHTSNSRDLFFTVIKHVITTCDSDERCSMDTIVGRK